MNFFFWHWLCWKKEQWINRSCKWPFDAVSFDGAVIARSIILAWTGIIILTHICTTVPVRDLKIRQHNQQWKHRQNNHFALAAHLFVHFVEVFADYNMILLTFMTIMTTMEDISKQQQNFILFLNLDTVLRNSTPGGFAYTWQSTCNWEGIFEMKTKRM